MRNIVIVVLGLFLTWQYSVAGSDGWRDNLDVLPHYCKKAAVEGQRWRRQCGRTLGPGGCKSLNHYCKGIYAEYKAKLSANERERDRLLQTVVQQMWVYSTNCKQGCVLYPELHTRWGWALQEKAGGDSAEAIKHYRLAIQVKPTYTLAYARLADLYVELKLPEEARTVLEAGLKAKPGARALQRRLQELETSQ